MSDEKPGPLVNLKKVRGAWMLPRPDWDVVDAWILRHVAAPDRFRAWGEVVDQWLDRLGRALRGGYRVVGEKELRLLTAEEEDTGLLNFAQTALDEIRKLIGDLATSGWRGPLPLLHFADQSDYYTYLNHFYPEGERGGSAGCCIQGGYVHIAIAPSHINQLQLVAEHELTHACLFHLRLPAWLEEGATQYMEGVTQSWGHSPMRDEDLLELRRFWNQEGLSDFWWGRGFTRPDERQRHSYYLSRVFFRLLLWDHRARFRDFVAHARAADAGESAARSALDLGLGDLAAKFLGKGDWTPQPPDAATFCERAGFHLAAGHLADALADVEEALRQEPGLSQAHTRLGDVCAARREYARAIRGFEKALELSPRDLASCNMLAWLRATCPEDAVRDGPRAVKLATRACELSGFASSHYLDTLAAAYAEAGDFVEACSWQKEAVHLAPQEEKEDYRSSLQLYRSRQPLRVS